MVTRVVTGIRVDPNAEKSVPIADLRAVYARHDADLRAVAERTGAKLLDVFPDVCGNGANVLTFFGAREPKFTRRYPSASCLRTGALHFLDFFIDVVVSRLPGMSEAALIGRAAPS